MAATDSQKTLYHVCARWDGDDLRSLVTRLGEMEGIEEYARRWPDAGDLALDHAYRVHLYATLAEAVAHRDEYGGEILEIDATWLNPEVDGAEFAHPMVARVPAHCVRRLSEGGR